MKKIIYILSYFYITRLLPSLGTSSFFFESKFIWVQKLAFSILGIIFFYTELKYSLKKLTKKNIVIFSVIPSLLICLFYILFLLIIDKKANFESYNNLSIILFANYIVLTPFVEELVYRYSFIVSSHNKILRTLLLLSSSIIFTSGHTASVSYNVLYLVPFLFMALTLSYIYIKNNNVWYCIVCHSLYNLIVIAIGYF